MSKRAAKASWNEMLESHKGQQPFPHTAHGITINLKEIALSVAELASPATNHIVASRLSSEKCGEPSASRK